MLRFDFLDMVADDTFSVASASLHSLRTPFMVPRVSKALFWNEVMCVAQTCSSG